MGNRLIRLVQCLVNEHVWGCDTEVVEQHRPEASPASDFGVECRRLPVNGTICTACQVVPPPLLAGLVPSVRLRSDGSTIFNFRRRPTGILNKKDSRRCFGDPDASYRMLPTRIRSLILDSALAPSPRRSPVPPWSKGGFAGPGRNRGKARSLSLRPGRWAGPAW